jgi:hypothetical protein
VKSGPLLRERARAGALTAEEIELVARHLHGHQPDLVREAAIALAGDFLECTSHGELLYALIAISDDAEEPDAVRMAAARALARATGYRGKLVRLDL